MENIMQRCKCLKVMNGQSFRSALCANIAAYCFALKLTAGSFTVGNISI
jgi:hypothetical protein